MTEFIHLHVHSDYSLTDASVKIASLVGRAKELGMTHLALTDHGNMFGAMEFIEACKRHDNAVKPIIGCEFYVSPGSRFDKKGAEYENNFFHLILLAYNRKGYFNLVKLCSYAYTEGFYHRPRIDEELLSLHHDGIIALSACLSGEIPRLIQTGKIDEAEKKALYYKELFGKDDDGNPNFYIEIQDHGIPADALRGSSLSQSDINKILVNIAEKTNVPVVATNDVHYLERDDYVAHDILLCIGTGKNRSDEKRKKYYKDQFYFKTGDEMASLFSEYPQAIENSVRIANRCVTDVPNLKDDLPKYLPEFDIPEGFDNAGNFLRHITMKGLEKRYPKQFAAGGAEWEDIKKRADYELGIIISMSFTGYFLIVADFIRFAKEKNIPVGPGRGSGAGSIVAYSLRITDIDPLKYNLLFERFLNPERISMPDFDIDFANYGREEVINYVTGKYGKDRVGQIITFGTLGAKQVIKDVARTLGISIPESEMITKLIPRGADVTLEKAIKEEAKLRDYESNNSYAELFKLARKLEGLNRHSSLHAAGVVIGKHPLAELVPLYQEREDSKTGKAGSVATQYSMNYLEPCGLIKMDFLGLKTLDVIKNTEDLIRLRGGKYSDFSAENAPEDDKAAFKMLGEGNSFEIFQFESDGMQNILKQTKPTSIDDLIALNAMYRPGPMDNIPRFVECKNGRQEISYPDPALESVLKDTYGVIIYQEQVMQVARVIAGYSMGRADILRKAMGKKKPKDIAAERKPFIEGALKMGFSEKKAGDLYDMMVPFGGYGFNKSHAAAYAIIAYRTAYLKANFPAEFMAANLTNEINSADKDKLSKCIDEARKMNIKVVPPNINLSDKYFAVVDGKIIFGFLGIKGIGSAPAEEIVNGREGGLYKGFIDFLDRVNIKAVGKKVIELLVQTGAFDSFGITRETLVGNLDRTFEYALKKKEEMIFGQTNLFDDAEESVLPDYKFEEFPQMSRTDRLNLEKQLIGFYFSGHPMDEYKEVWEKAVTVNLESTENLKTGNCILVGLVKNIKSIVTSKGSKMGFASLSDYNGEIELTFFSGAWEKLSGRIENDKVSILKGKIEYQKEKDKYSFIVDDIVSKYDIDNVVNEIKETEEKDKLHKVTWMYMADLKSSYIKMAKKGNYTVIGYLKSLRDHKDKNGNEMAFGSLQDFDGDIDIVFFSKVYAECRHLLNLNEMIALKGSIDPDNERNPEKISFKVTSIADYPQLSRTALKKDAASEEPVIPELRKEEPEARQVDKVHIRLISSNSYNEDDLHEFRECLAENSGSLETFIYIPVINNETSSSAGEIKIRASHGLDITPDNAVIEELKKCKCVAEVWRI